MSALLESATPLCMAFIMDGNRRWAQARGVSAAEGHAAGYYKLKEVVRWSRDAGVRHVAVYALSTENWHRAEAEVSALMELFRFVMDKQLPELRQENVAIHLVGQIDLFPKDIQNSIHNMHASNPVDAAQHLWVCASYGGRAEIVAATNALIGEGKRVVTEEDVTHALWTRDMPTPDIIVRTGGEKRLSNFLMWHAGYSELFFLDVLWPDFSQADFEKVLEDYTNRKRNYGI